MKSSINVLIVDDNPIDRELICRLLAQQNTHCTFECVESERGRIGIEQFHCSKPGCVLLDLNLPDMDGLDVLRSIVRDSDACPVIVMTAYGSERLAVEAMKAGAADYLVKGAISGEALAHVIENALEKRRLQLRIQQQQLAIEERNSQLVSALERERAARSAVEESESRYRVLAEAMPQLVWTAGHPSGGWDYVNERWTRLTGAPPEAAFGYGWLEFIEPEDREHVRSAWQTSVARPEPAEMDCRILSSTGASRWQLMRAVPLIQNGQTVKWLGTFTDIDDQRRTEQLLHHRQKLESIGILAGGVAHDFNNLLLGIIGGVSYALDVLPAGHELVSVLEGALRSGERAAQLTRQLLAYAGKGSFNVEDVDLAQLLSATWELIHASIPRSVDLQVVVDPDLPPVYTDPTQLQQVIMNLILNASEAIPADRQGIVVIRASAEQIDRPKTTWSGDLAVGKYVAIEVIDNGSGIEPDLIAKVFDPFFTTKFTGRGLGLAAVHGIIRSNHGSIEVDSVPGKGSKFRVLLPAGTTFTKKTPEAPEVTPHVTDRQRVLVVDDEPVVLSTVKAALERLGHAVDVVLDGRTALERLARCPKCFSLVLLDLGMPGLDGEGTFEAIRRHNPDLPIVICSGYSDTEVQSKFLGRKVSGFLQKPFHFQTLSKTVSDLLSSA